jgi:hypothetical protein
MVDSTRAGDLALQYLVGVGRDWVAIRDAVSASPST